jgi:hypothetical protein
MPSQIESISLFRVALGVAFALFALAVIELGYYHPSTAALVATILLAISITSQGLRPFGDTVAYYLIQAATFAFWGIMMMVTVKVTIISAVFAVSGLIGILNYGCRAKREGIWSTVD